MKQRRKRRRNRMPKGMGTVYKLKDKDRYGNLTHRKKPYVWYLKGKYMGSYETRDEAELEARLYHKDHKESDDITFSKIWELWLEQKSGTISEHTVKNYQSKYRTYCKPLYDRAYKDLRPKDFLEVVNSHDVSNGTKNNTLKFFRALDRFAYELDIIDKKYAESLEMYKKDKKRRNVPFSEEEINYLWNHPELEDSDLVLILIYTGMRPGELPILKISDIHSDHLIAGFKTEAGTDRYIPIHPRIKPLIERRLKECKKDTFLNYSYKQLGVRFRKLMKQLGWDHHLHECRHTFITRMDDAGANRVCIDLIVGHKSSHVGMSVYTHKTQQQLMDNILLLT